MPKLSLAFSVSVNPLFNVQFVRTFYSLKHLPKILQYSPPIPTDCPKLLCEKAHHSEYSILHLISFFFLFFKLYITVSGINNLFLENDFCQRLVQQCNILISSSISKSISQHCTQAFAMLHIPTVKQYLVKGN